MEEKLNNYPNVAVLMSTYNGERYIRKQLDSIVNQKNVNIQLIIRDDGSTDTTIMIIQDYVKKFHNIEFYQEHNVGAANSFIELLYFVLENYNEFDYYAFADQDDIWLENKLEAAVKMIEMKSEPCLYCSNQTLLINGVIENNRFVGPQQLSLKARICKTDFCGCTMVFNKNLAQVLKKIEHPSDSILVYRYHDTWIYFVACIYGSVIYDENSYIIYRIHDNNTVGLQKLTLKKRIQRYLKKDNPGRNLRSKTAKELLDKCIVTRKEDKDVLEEFAYYRKNIKSRLKLIKDKDIRNRSGEKAWVFAIKVFLNLF